MAMKIACTIHDAHSSPILCVAFDDNRNEIYTGGKDCLIKVWDSESGKLLRYQQQHSNWVMDLLFVPAPVKMLFSCSLDGNIVVWSDRGRLLQVIDYGGPTFCMGWDSKRRQLLVGSRGAIQAYVVLRSSANYIQSDSERKTVAYLKFLELSFCLCHHDDVVLDVCCSQKGKVFTVGMDRALCIFDSDRPNDTLKKVPNCHEGGITTVTIDEDGKWLVTGAYDGTVKIWSQEGHCLDSFDNVTDCVTSIAYVAPTKSFWVSGKHKSVVVIDPLAPADMTEWVADTSEFHNLILNKVLHSRKKELVIGLSIERKVVTWKYDDCAPHRVLHGHSNWVEVVITAKRRACKERLLMKDMTDVLPERTKFRANLTKSTSQSPALSPGAGAATPSSSFSEEGNSTRTLAPASASETATSASLLSLPIIPPATTSKTEAAPTGLHLGATVGLPAAAAGASPAPAAAASAGGPTGASSTPGPEIEAVYAGLDDESRSRIRKSKLGLGLRLDPVALAALTNSSVTFESEVFSGSSDGSIHKWLPHPDPNKDVWMRRALAPRTHKAITCMLHHTDLDVLIVGCEDACINIWTMDGNRSVPLWRSAVRQAGGPDILKGHTAKVVGLCALPELVLVSASADKSLRFWDLSNRLPTDVYELAQEHAFQDMTYSPSRGEIATCGGDPHVKIWGGQRRKRVKCYLRGASGDIIMVRWCASHEGLWVTASEEGAVCTWNPINQTATQVLCILKQPITTLFVDEENDFLLLSYIYDHSIRVHRLWSLEEEVCSYKGHSDQVHSITYLKERHQFISASWDTSLRVWLAPPKDKLQVESKKLDLQTMMIRQQDGPGEAPSDEFDLAEEMKRYISDYEKAHPIVMPKVLVEPMNVNILFLQSSDQIPKPPSNAKITAVATSIASIRSSRSPSPAPHSLPVHATATARVGALSSPSLKQ